ncbi:hypothetical protein MJ636_017945, partial [Proteus mirabilis]|uniref:hypothetical protein n=1 Tax=Proteus mirabilis TaxID=584 RepID=UPI001FB8A771
PRPGLVLESKIKEKKLLLIKNCIVPPINHITIKASINFDVSIFFFKQYMNEKETVNNEIYVAVFLIKSDNKKYF